MAANRSAQEWQRLVAEWRGSGLPCKAFAAGRGVHPHTLSWWAWRLESRPPVRVPARPGEVEPVFSARAARPGFVEVVVSEAPLAVPPGFVVEVGDLRVRVPLGFDAGELRRLVGTLC